MAYCIPLQHTRFLTLYYPLLSTLYNNQSYQHSSSDVAMGDFTPATEEISCTTKFKAAENANSNTKSIKDIGLTDGEGMERLWSYLSGFVNMTRHMDSRRRMKTLVRAIQRYRLKVIFGLAANLKRRANKAKKLLKEAEEFFDIHPVLSNVCLNSASSNSDPNNLEAIKENVEKLLWYMFTECMSNPRAGPFGFVLYKALVLVCITDQGRVLPLHAITNHVSAYEYWCRVLVLRKICIEEKSAPLMLQELDANRSSIFNALGDVKDIASSSRLDQDNMPVVMWVPNCCPIQVQPANDCPASAPPPRRPRHDKPTTLVIPKSWTEWRQLQPTTTPAFLDTPPSLVHSLQQPISSYY